MDLELEGAYTLKLVEKGKVIEERVIPNHITLEGKSLLFDYLTDQSGRFINYISIGLSNVGNTLDSSGKYATNTDMVHEILRQRVESKTYSAPSGSASAVVSFHTNAPPGLGVGNIEEIGVFDRIKSESDDEPNNLLISDFDVASDWNQGTTDTATVKSGNASLAVPTITSSTVTSFITTLDLSGFASDSTIAMFVYPQSIVNLNNISLRFKTSATSYYEAVFTVFTPSAWNLKSSLKGNFSAVGSPDWSNITQVDLIINQSVFTSYTINFDSLRVIPLGSSSIMFSRAVVSPPVPKTSKQELILGYDLTFTVP